LVIYTATAAATEEAPVYVGIVSQVPVKRIELKTTSSDGIVLVSNLRGDLPEPQPPTPGSEPTPMPKVSDDGGCSTGGSGLGGLGSFEFVLLAAAGGWFARRVKVGC
jgi:hypothetical protein